MAAFGAVNMFRVSLYALIIASSLTILTTAQEKMTVVYKPDHMRFHEGKHIRVNDIPEVFSTALGFTKLKDDQWEGLEAGNPLRRPEAIVVLEVEGLNPRVDGLQFPLELDVEPGLAYQMIADRIYVRFAERKPVLFCMNNDGSIESIQSEYPWLLNSVNPIESTLLGEDPHLMDAPLTQLNLSRQPDAEFVSQVKRVFDTTSLVANKSYILANGVPDLFWYHISGGIRLKKAYGKNSPQIEEANEIISRLITHICDCFAKSYDGNFMFVYLNVDDETENSLRVGRSLLAEPTEAPKYENKYRIAYPYDVMYAPIFNIVLLVSLVFWLAVFAIAIGIWNMDPGRDSIIYRITSQRMKKDQ